MIILLNCLEIIRLLNITCVHAVELPIIIIPSVRISGLLLHSSKDVPQNKNATGISADM